MLHTIAALALAAAPAAAPMRKPAHDERELRRIEAALCKSYESGDAATLRRYLDARFTLTSSRGEVTDFAQNVAEVEKREPAYDVFRNHDETVRFYGDAAIITGITSIKGRVDGKPYAGDFQYTDTWVREDGTWKLAASHASRLGQ